MLYQGVALGVNGLFEVIKTLMFYGNWHPKILRNEKEFNFCHLLKRIEICNK